MNEYRRDDIDFFLSEIRMDFLNIFFCREVDVNEGLIVVVLVLLILVLIL
jgi:hypothetical protein